MNDTSPDIEKLMIKKFKQLSGSQRLKMGCSMFDTAKIIAENAIRNEQGQISEREMTQQIFLRFYREDFSAIETEKILKVL